MLKIERSLPLLILLLVLVALASLPTARAPDEFPDEFPQEMPEEMIGMGLLGMFTKLDVQVQTGVLNLMTETATIYIQVTQGGMPLDVEKLYVILIYNDGNWTTTPPMFFGFWELQTYNEEPDPSHDICNYTWIDGNMDGDVGEDEKIHIPGLYVVTVSYKGFLPGDYLIWAYAEAPLMMEEFMGNSSILDMFGNMSIPIMLDDIKRRGVGTGSFTVSSQLTVATQIIIGDLRGEVSIIKADVAETIAALPEFYTEVRDLQQATSSGIPLLAMAFILPLISVVLLVKLTRNSGSKESS